MRLGIPLLATVAACQVDDVAQPDLSDLNVVMRWTDPTHRTINVSLRHTKIPCEGVEKGFLGEDGKKCRSADWALTIDGVPVSTTPIECEAAHEGLFGHVDEYCTGGAASTVQLFDGASPDIEIVATSDVDEQRVMLHGVRRTYGWTEQAPFRNVSDPGVVRVDGLALDSESFLAHFTAPGSDATTDGEAHLDRDDPTRLVLVFRSPPAVDGVFGVRVLGYADDGRARIAVPLTGTITVARAPTP